MEININIYTFAKSFFKSKTYMNILYLLGNGADLSLNLKTSYPDFYRVYKNSRTSRELVVNDIKKSIEDCLQKKKVNWSDLEMGLADYTTNINTINDFGIAYDDIISNLHNYLESVQEGFPCICESEQINMRKQLVNPADFFFNNEKNVIKDYMNYIDDYSCNLSYNVNVFTFNFTNTIDKILGFYNNNNIDCRFVENNHQVTIHKPIHLHGTLENSILFGIDNRFQIANPSFRESSTIENIFVKPKINKAIDQVSFDYCDELIHDAHIIVIKGWSVGESDRRWVNKISNWLKKTCDARLILHMYSPLPIHPHQRNRINILNENNYSNLREKFNFPSGLWESTIKDKIKFTYNTNLLCPNINL